jgi:protein-disulfide isomerase
MQIRSFLLALGATIALPAAVIAAKPANWLGRVTLTPSGAYVVGNPAAPTKVVEYVSYTCSHCAEFVKTGTAPLKAGWVRSGKASVEVRNAIRDRYDLTAALLARCGGPTRFAGNHEALFANYEPWIAQLQAYEQSNPQVEGEQAVLNDIAAKTGLNTLMAKRGFTPAQLKTCLADPNAMKTVLGMADEAWNQRKISGTPSFLVNGTAVNGSTWDALKAALPAPAN